MVSGSSFGRIAAAGAALVMLAAVAAPAQAQSTGVTIQNLSFMPGTIQIPVGATVTWTNQDSVAHTVTSDSGAFDSGVMVQGGKFSFTFSQAGVYAYHCAIHPFMTGQIMVGSSTAQATSTPAGAPTSTPAGAPTSTPSPVPSSTPAPAPTTSPLSTFKITVSGALHAGKKGTVRLTVKDNHGHLVKAAHVSANLHAVGVAKTLNTSTNVRGQAGITFTPRRAGLIPLKVAKSGFRSKTVKVQARS